MGRISTFGQHLYEGRVSFDFVGRRKLWYTISAMIVILAAVAFGVRGFNFGIEFRGGVEFTAQVQNADEQTVEDFVTAVRAYDRLLKLLNAEDLPDTGLTGDRQRDDTLRLLIAQLKSS